MKHKNIYNSDCIEQAYRDTMISGLPKGLHTGVNNLDELFRLDRGKLVVCTGIPNMGKSEFIDFLCSQYNKLHGMRTLYFSPENQPIAYHIGKLFRKYECRRDNKEDINDARSVAVRKYIYDNFTFFNYTKEFTIGEIIATAREVVYERGAEILVIDSYNKVSRDISVNETETIGRELDFLERFAKELNIIIILVAHPRKMEKGKDGKYVIPSAYDINGSAHFFNKADFVISVHRNYEPNYAIIKVDKVKFNNYGGQGIVNLGYSNISGNYFDIPDEVDFIYNESAYFEPPTEKPFDLNTHMKSGEEWLSVSCAFSPNVKHKGTSETNLFQFLTCDHPDLIACLEKVRSTTDNKERSVLKASLLPIVCPSVVIDGERRSENIKSYTNLMCIDIDAKDNPKSIASTLDVLQSLPYVAFAQRSASGNGYFAIIPIRDGRNLEEHFNAISAELEERGIIVDKSCKDAVRARFYSYDPNYYVNPCCCVYMKRKKLNKGEHKILTSTVTNPPRFSTPNLTNSLDQACKGIESFNVCPTYKSWLEVGCALAKELGESGRKYFHTLSCGYPEYSKSATDTKYDELLPDASKYSYNSGTIFHYINQAKGGSV